MKKKSRYRLRKPLFSEFAHRFAHWTGRPPVFFMALAVILIWIISGPYFDYSEGWQLTVNTGTTIITFLMVFLIQHTQNRESHAIQLKLDELIRATKGAHTVLLDIEELSEKDLMQVREQYQQLAAKAREKLQDGRRDTGSPGIKLH